MPAVLVQALLGTLYLLLPDQSAVSAVAPESLRRVQSFAAFQCGACIHSKVQTQPNPKLLLARSLAFEFGVKMDREDDLLALCTRPEPSMQRLQSKEAAFFNALAGRTPPRRIMN